MRRRCNELRRASGPCAFAGSVALMSDSVADAESTPTAPETADYPVHWEADVVLRDGRTCHIRPIRATDREALEEFHQTLSEDTLYMRYFTASQELMARDIERLLNADHREHVALLALAGGAVIGLGAYDSVGRAEGEIAFTIRDDHQGRGLGSVLLEHLAAIARENGIHRFRAEVLSGNKKMLATFAAAGYSPSQEVEDGIVLLDFDIDPTQKSRTVARSREHRAESLSIQRVIAPNSVVVVCDDVSAGAPGPRVTANLLAGGFLGHLAIVSPSGLAVDGVEGHKTLAEIGVEIDLVVMALPPDGVEPLLPDCARAGVRGIVLVTGDFITDHDYSRQQALVHTIRGLGLRLVGPNSLGLINTDPGVNLNASLVPEMPHRGRIGFFSQTGAFGSAILAEAGRRGLGVSTFVSAGNRADVSANDMLQYWEDDDSTSLVLLYLESIGNPRKFTRIAQRLSRLKPIVAVRAGRSTQALPLGHAVRHTDLAPEAVDAMFRQAGVIQVDSLSEMLDLAGLLAFQPRPAGNRVGIVTDSDPLGMLAMDSSLSIGLDPVGPVQIVDTAASAEENSRAIQAVLDDPGVDALVVTHVPPVIGGHTALAQSLVSQARDATKPIISVELAPQEALLAVDKTTYGMPAHASVPLFGDVESGLRALRSVVTYSDWLAAPRGSIPKWSGMERNRAHQLAVAAVTAAEVDDDAARLTPEVIEQLLESYGIEVWAALPATSEEEAVAAADELGYPVVLKTAADDLVHRTDLGGVRLTLENEHALRTAFLSMTATLPPTAHTRLVVQRMAPAGVACVAATTEDPLFGPVVSFRLGGLMPELLGDIAYQIPPLTSEDARTLVRAPKGSALLTGEPVLGRPGNEGVDLDALEDLLARLGQLADDLPEVAVLELNPIVAHAKGVAVLAAKGRVARPLARTDLEARRLL